MSLIASNMDLDLDRWICMMLEWTPSLLQDQPFSADRAAASFYHLKRRMGDSEPPDIFQHHYTVYLRTRVQETLYETNLCHSH